MSQQQQIRKIAYMGMYLALYFVLDWIAHTIPLFKMPQGGSLGLSVIALLLASYHLGWKRGVLVGLLSVLIQFMTGHVYIIQNSDGFSLWQILLQFLMEYPIAFGIYGLSVLFKNFKNFYTGVLVTGLIRLALHVIAGHYYWGSPWWASFTYNAWYMIPTILLSLIVIPILIPRLKHLLK